MPKRRAAILGAAGYTQTSGGGGEPPADPPDTPTIISGIAGYAGQATVSFTPAATGEPATSYRVSSWALGQTVVTASGSSSPITITGLNNNRAYNFTVAAHNDAGYSGESLPTPIVAVPVPTPLRTLYVSTTGNNANNGTSPSTPWRTFYYAVNQATGGDVINFANGTYDETQQPWQTGQTTGLNDPARNGSAAHPIVLQASNRRGAIIRFNGTTLTSNKVYFHDDFVIFRGLRFTSTSSSGSGSDQMISGRDCDHAMVIDCEIDNARYGVKMTTDSNTPGCTNFTVANCDIHNNIASSGDGANIDLLNGYGGIVLNCHLYDTDGQAFMVKGGCRNMMVVGNLIESSTHSTYQGITLGGSTGKQWAYVPEGESGPTHESFNTVVMNNIFRNNGTTMGTAVVFRGQSGCSFINNTVIGCGIGLASANGGDPGNSGGGGAWTAYNDDIYAHNNIFHSVPDMESFGGADNTISIDYNLLYSSQSISQSHAPPSGTPNYVNIASDWHYVTPGSYAVDVGETIATRPLYQDVNTPATATMDTDFDRDTFPRTAPYNVGAY